MERRLSHRDIMHIPMFAIVIAACSWVSIPSVVPFTMQSFGVFLTLILIGGRKGTAAIVLYVLLGLIGLPMFHGGTGGPGVLFGSTGGYIIGFVFMGLIYRLVTAYAGDGFKSRIIGLLLGMTVCYIVGTGWFLLMYIRDAGEMGMAAALGWCVLPFIIPDLVKLAAAAAAANKLQKHMEKLYL